jgi:hypothetical protein
MLEGKGFSLLKQKNFFNSVLISSRSLKNFKNFFHFCRNQIFLVSYDNMQICLKLSSELQLNKLIAISCYGYFLNTDMGGLVYLFNIIMKIFF